jgi:hypothetical protein
MESREHKLEFNLLHNSFHPQKDSSVRVADFHSNVKFAFLKAILGCDTANILEKRSVSIVWTKHISSTLKSVAARSSETSVHLYQTTRYYIPEGSIQDTVYCH